MSIRGSGINAELGSRVEALGFDLVAAEWAGSRSRPVLRLRIDFSTPKDGASVQLDDCKTVSRGLEEWLDAHADVPERYVLEVSSPGLDRPLTRAKDWARFAGKTVAIKGRSVLSGNEKRVEGEILGLEEGKTDEPEVRVRLNDGEELSVPLGDIERAHLVHRWK